MRFEKARSSDLIPASFPGSGLRAQGSGLRAVPNRCLLRFRAQWATLSAGSGPSLSVAEDRVRGKRLGARSGALALSREPFFNFPSP